MTLLSDVNVREQSKNKPLDFVNQSISPCHDWPMITTGKSGNNTTSFEFQIADIFRENVVDRIITFWSELKE